MNWSEVAVKVARRKDSFSSIVDESLSHGTHGCGLFLELSIVSELNQQSNTTKLLVDMVHLDIAVIDR